MAIDRSKAIHKKVNMTPKQLNKMVNDLRSLKYDAPNNTKRNGVTRSKAKKTGKK